MHKILRICTVETLVTDPSPFFLRDSSLSTIFFFFRPPSLHFIISFAEMVMRYRDTLLIERLFISHFGCLIFQTSLDSNKTLCVQVWPLTDRWLKPSRPNPNTGAVMRVKKRLHDESHSMFVCVSWRVAVSLFSQQELCSE